MARFNRFGTTYASVIAMYPGTVLADYDSGGVNGQTKVEAALDRAVRMYAAALSPDVYTQMSKVEAEQPVVYASAGQASFTLGLGPILSGSLHVWRYPSLAAIESGYSGGEQFADAPIMGLWEESHVSASTTGAVVTVSFTNGVTLGVGERVFASYVVDLDSASFAMPSIADLCLYGAATELGAFLYTDGSQEWKLVDEYRKRWEAALKAATSGEWIPDELRALDYWQDVERTSAEVKSIIRRRA